MLPPRLCVDRVGGLVMVVAVIGELIVPRPEPERRNEPDAKIVP